MTIELNGKKVNKIMLGGKEVMSSGVDIADWMSNLKQNLELNVSNGREESRAQFWITPQIPISSSIKKINLLRLGTGMYEQYQFCFYRSDMSFISGSEQNISNSSATSITIPTNVAFLKFSGQGGPLQLSFTK